MYTDNIKNTVTIDLETYNDYIITKFEQGNIYETLNQKITKLKIELQELQEQRNTLLELLFRENRMGSDTRAEQISLDSRYAGYDTKSTKFLYQFGFTKQELIDFINKKWDEREERERIEEENND